ncbi:hypothetical protein M2480_002648, partial [Parabacteroides sp. PFB2-12]|nr:hypothetical protein [Parabacteroides sp. PFB2-12]
PSHLTISEAQQPEATGYRAEQSMIAIRVTPSFLPSPFSFLLTNH